MMKIFSGTKEAPKELGPLVLTLGNFDGCHLGHQALIDQLRSKGVLCSAQTAVMTFDPHPQQILRPESPLQLLSSREEKRVFLNNLGVNILFEQPFSRALSNMEADDFLEKILFSRLDIRHFVIGYDFRFGRSQSGGMKLLKQKAKEKGIEVDQVQPFQVNGVTVSSSLIRKLLSRGEVENIPVYLGRPYGLAGHVIQGQKRGRTLNFPTANLLTDKNRMIPKKGVYITKCELENGESIHSVTNIGQNPTFENSQKFSLENHLLDWSGDLYGQELKVFFLKYLRSEEKFSGPEELRLQIKKDVEAAREFFT
jgi:riboflavin kinase/FMN adenylyltransferase